MSPQFRQRLEGLVSDHQALINRPNFADETWTNGLFRRYRHPVLTAAHTPLTWRYDLDEKTNPFLIERQGINAAFNAGAIELGGRFYLVARVEGHDRKSLFAVAQSESPIDGWRFWDYPLTMPEASEPDTNVYDMRLTAHQDGWIYGLFCTERKDPKAPPGDLSTATAQCGMARTRDLVKMWQRLPDLKSRLPAAAQRRAASGVCPRPVRLLHPAAGRFHPGRFRRRHRLGVVRLDGKRRHWRREDH